MAAAHYPPLDFASIGAPVIVSNMFTFTEGPVWSQREKALYFSDINADTIYRLKLPNTFEIALQPANHPDGLALDPQGKLLLAGFVARDVARVQGSQRQVIAGSYQDKRLNSPDDLIARSDGTIYFTDPAFGIDGTQGLGTQTQEQPFQGVYRISPDGIVHLEDQSTSDGPNGVALSPDERTLYVSYTTTGEVARYTVNADGSLTDRATLAANVILADSLCIDAGGNLYVASLLGITVLDPMGTVLGTIPTMNQVPTNCELGGPDLRTLFITARDVLSSLFGGPMAGGSSLMRIDAMPIPGIPEQP